MKALIACIAGAAGSDERNLLSLRLITALKNSPAL